MNNYIIDLVIIYSKISIPISIKSQIVANINFSPIGLIIMTFFFLILVKYAFASNSSVLKYACAQIFYT